MFTYIKAYKSPNNPVYQKYLKVLIACRNANVELPEVIAEYFKSSDPYPGLELEPLEIDIPFSEFIDDKINSNIYVIRVSDIPDGTDLIKFINAY